MKYNVKKALIGHLKNVRLLMSVLLILLPWTLFSQNIADLHRATTNDGEFVVIPAEGAENMADWYVYYEYMREEYIGINTELELLDEAHQKQSELVVELNKQDSICVLAIDKVVASNRSIVGQIDVEKKRVKELDVKLYLQKKETDKYRKKSRRKTVLNVVLIGATGLVTGKLLKIY